MTINLSSKSGSASGGTGLVKDPRALAIAMVHPGQANIKVNYNSSYNDGNSNFWTSYSKFGQYIVYATNDTWQTVVDVNNSYGSVYNLIGPTHHASYGTGAHHFRITVDGTEYLIEPAADVSRKNQRLVVGTLLPIVSPVTSDNDELPNEVGSYYDDGIYGYPNTMIQPTALVSGGYIPDPLTAFMQGSPYLYFTESFKFEVKISSMNTVFTNYKNAGCVLNYMGNF